MKIAILGTGYVGLVTGTCLSDFGHHVTCFDIQSDKIAQLSQGFSPIYEPGLESLIHKNSLAGRLDFSSDPQCLAHQDIIFVAVGTPPQPSGEVDVTQLEGAVSLLAEYAFSDQDGFKVIINKSTVPIGKGRQFERRFLELGIAADRVGVISNPEFLREGCAIEDFFNPDRIVLGGHHVQALAVVRELYRPFLARNIPFFETNLETAELIKYASNAFLATKISFINEMANLCDVVGADVSVLSQAMGADHRIGRHFLNPGPGYGGSCFPKDTQALTYMASQAGYDLSIVPVVEAVNRDQKQVAIQKTIHHLGTDLTKRSVAILGLAFKPDTDDIRESSALPVVAQLLELGATISVFDPVAMANCRPIFGDKVRFSATAIDAATGCDALIILTDWNEFKELDLALFMAKMKTPIMIDMRNLYDPRHMADVGFVYDSLGRPQSNRP